jgi:hypothetical protein
MMAERTASMMNDENHQPMERPAMLAREDEEEDEEGEEAEQNNGDIRGGEDGTATALPTSVTHNANNRFCGLGLESEEHLQLHHLMKHRIWCPPRIRKWRRN